MAVGSKKKKKKIPYIINTEGVGLTKLAKL